MTEKFDATLESYVKGNSLIVPDDQNDELCELGIAIGKALDKKYKNETLPSWQNRVSVLIRGYSDILIIGNPAQIAWRLYAVLYHLGLLNLTEEEVKEGFEILAHDRELDIDSGHGKLVDDSIFEREDEDD